MPKPKFGVNGSGMHINMSLQKDGKNIFQDASDPNGLSKEAYYFIGGIMKHIKGMAAITNPMVNSYKRLVLRFRGTGLHCMEHDEPQKPLIRIPATADGEGTRIELRSPDSAANPYLTLAVCLSAGLQGIREKILPPESINANIFADRQRAERAEHRPLPGTLLEAVEELEKDTFIQDVLGNHIAGKYIDAKHKEWQEYRSQVSEWEIQEYLYKY